MKGGSKQKIGKNKMMKSDKVKHSIVFVLIIKIFISIKRATRKANEREEEEEDAQSTVMVVSNGGTWSIEF